MSSSPASEPQNIRQILKAIAFVAVVSVLGCLASWATVYFINFFSGTQSADVLRNWFQSSRAYVGVAIILIGVAFSVFIWQRQKNTSWLSKLPAHALMLILFISIGLAITSPLFGWLVPITTCGGGVVSIVALLSRTSSYPPYYSAILHHLYAKNYDRALEFVEKSLQQKPNNWKTYQARAAIYCSMGEWEKAENDARQVFQLRPQEKSTYEFLGCALINRGDYAEAVSTLRKAVEISSRGDFLAMLAKANYRLGDYAAAAQNFERALQKQLNPKSRYLTATYYLASSLEKIGEVQRAQAAYQQMARYKQTLPELKALWADKTHLEANLMNADIAEIERRIASL